VHRRPVLRPLALALASLAACASVEPILPGTVRTALVEQPMRRLDTNHFTFYYPARRREDTYQLAGELERCLVQLVQRSGLAPARSRYVVLVPEVNYNNAFVTPPVAGNASLVVQPLYEQADLFAALQIGKSPGLVGCHEAVHAFMLRHIRGFAGALSTLFGDLYSPQLGLDSWIHEGMATYFESQLTPGTGRMSSPVFRGLFAAAVAGERLDGGDLHLGHRRWPMGAQYLVGAHFIEYLARRHGEARLWQLVDLQSRAIFFPLWLSLRFRAVYGETLSSLIDEFAEDVRRRTPARQRPADQQRVREAGEVAVYARAPDGSEAVISEGRDQAARLRIYDPRGERRVDRLLTGIVPPRKLVSASARFASGLSFTRDGRTLYFTLTDQGPVHLQVRLVRVDAASGALAVVSTDLAGAGGSVTPSGSHYVHPRIDGNRHHLAELDLHTGRQRILHRRPVDAAVSLPQVSPDDRHIALVAWNRRSAELWLHERGGRPLRRLSPPGVSVYDPVWLDAGHLAYAAPAAGRLQIFVVDLATGASRQLTRAPYLAMAPAAAGPGRLRFLNRDGLRWTLDEVALSPPPPGHASAAPRPAAPTSAAAFPVAPAPGTATPTAAPGTHATAMRAWSAAAAPTPGAAAAPTPGAAAAPTPGAAAAPTPGAAAAPTPGADAAPAPAGAVTPPLRVVRDRAYSGVDRLFVPSLRLPWLAATGDASFYGLALAGHDALHWHRWAVAAAYSPELETLDLSLGYANSQLAPWTILVTAAQASERRRFATDADDRPLYFTRRTRSGGLLLQRSFWTSQLSLAGLGAELDDGPGLLPARRTRLAGPGFDLSYGASETTPYARVRRGLALQLTGALYPQQLGSDFDLADLQGRIAVASPLPLSRRHTLHLSLVSRVLLGVPGDRAPLLEVGPGDTLVLYQSTPLPPSPDPGLPFTFSLRLRGYEDALLLTNRIAAGELSYRLPLIIDRGTASTLLLLPAVFLHELILEGFATAATTPENRLHAAVGGSLGAMVSLFAPIPLTVRYQLARRLRDDRELVHLVQLGYELPF
jgi:hypothetical protein